MSGNLSSILVIRLSALGDVVRTLPAVVAIRNAHPEARITWVTETLGASFVEGHPSINNVIVFPTRTWRKEILSPTGLCRTGSQVFASLKKLREGKYDAIVDFHGILKSGLICRAARARRRLGYDSSGSKELSWLFYDEKVSLPEEKLSRYERNMLLAAKLGGKVPDVSELIHVPETVIGEMSGFFDSTAGNGPLFAVHPGTSARAPYKRWMPNRYAQLCRRIVEDIGGRVILTWAPDELGFVEQIAGLASGKAVISPRTATPIHLAHILSRSDFYVGSDTGAMHIATLCGTPVIALWGPTDPVENEPGPYSPYKVVMGGADCSPCRHMGCIKGHCMETVSVDNVVSAIEELSSDLKNKGIPVPR